MQNVVCTVDAGCYLDLEEIATTAENVEYNPRKFAAVIMCLREPKTTALIFGTGKIVCTGAKDVEQARSASLKYTTILQRLGFPASFDSFRVQNVVGSGDVGYSVRVEGIRTMHPQVCTYEPEVFPGLIYRMEKPNVVILVFVSGKIVFTGAKSIEDVYQAQYQIGKLLTACRKGR